MTELSIPMSQTPPMHGTHFLHFLRVSSDIAFPPYSLRLVDLFLLINAIFARSTIYQQQEPPNDREDLEEVVLGKVLVGVVLMKLDIY
jgi:hypothetical protein